MNRNTIKNATGKWIIINGPDDLDWIGLIGEVRDSTNPWSDHTLEVLVAWNEGAPSWHEITIDNSSYQSDGTRIRPMLPPHVSWVRGLGFKSRNSNDFEGFDCTGVRGKRFRIVTTPERK